MGFPKENKESGWVEKFRSSLDKQLSEKKLSRKEKES